VISQEAPMQGSAGCAIAGSTATAIRPQIASHFVALKTVPAILTFLRAFFAAN
jgi:hypothetical protein